MATYLRMLLGVPTQSDNIFNRIRAAGSQQTSCYSEIGVWIISYQSILRWRLAVCELVYIHSRSFPCRWLLFDLAPWLCDFLVQRQVVSSSRYDPISRELSPPMSPCERGSPDKESEDMDEVLINTTTAGDQGQPSVCGLQGTQFVVVWEDRGDNTIKGQMFGTDGAKSSSEMLINLPTPPGPRRQLPAIVEFASGFVVAWTEQAAGSAATAPTQLKLRIFDADTLSGPEIQVSSSPVE